MMLPKFLKKYEEKMKYNNYISKNYVSDNGEKILYAYLFNKPLYNEIYEKAKEIGTEDLILIHINRYLSYQTEKTNKKRNVYEVNFDYER